jgi:dCTP deaminase
LGTLSDREILGLVAEGHIRSRRYKKFEVQPASLDLRLGSIAYRVRSSFLPQGESVQTLLPEMTLYQIDLNSHPYIEPGAIYIIPLDESLSLPATVGGKANPKSSTGRIDVFTRVLTENGHRFDDVPYGYNGPLYLELFSRSFPLRISSGLCLSQLRLFSSREILSDEDLLLLHKKYSLYSDEAEGGLQDGLVLGVDLSEGDVVGYRARKNSGILDLSSLTPLSPEAFWEPIKTPSGGALILEPEEFYLFASRSRLKIPKNFAAEMLEFDAQSGELRTHYAGFFDPGFGFSEEGAKAVLEVRPHDVPFRIVDGQRIFRLRYERMNCPPDKIYGQDIGSNYSAQGLKLSKYFSDFSF